MRPSSSSRAFRAVALATATLIVVLAIGAAAAHARSERRLAWSPAQVWPVAVRLVRVDLGLTITEQDQGAGYVLFEVREEGKRFAGALELIAADDGTRVAISITDRPSYMEIRILERLERKLRQELGVVAPTPAP